MKRSMRIGLAATLLLISGCSSTYITSSWKSPEYKAPARYQKIMVVGIIRDADRTYRERMEDHLVGDLKQLGYNAFSSYVEYGPKAFQNMSEEEVNKKLSKEGIDAVMTIVLLDKQRERRYVPASVVYSPYITYHGHFWGYYRSIHSRIEMPGYYDVSNRFFWESNLYDLTNQKLIYSVQTQTFDPSSIESLAHEYGQKIIESMIKNKVLEKQANQVVKVM